MSAQLRDDLWAGGGVSQNFLVLTVASCLIATLGLLENSVAVIIGAMVVAPLVGPIQAFAFGALTSDFALVRRALIAAGVGALIAIVASAALGAIIAIPAAGSEILARTRPTLLDLGIAIAAGAVGGFARVRPAISGTIAGTAIAVALMPPLCVVGLAAANGDWSWTWGALLLFGTNFFGIALACMAVYALAGGVAVRNHAGVTTTALVTAALLVPLGASFIEIVREATIETAVGRELRTNTVTFRSARLVGARFNWYSVPVTATLSVNSAEPITPSQMRDLQVFVAQRTGITIQLIADVSRVDQVEAASPSPVAPAFSMNSK